jgi:hypothetical protein
VPDYNEYQHPDVVVYELFLPLTCEDKLRRALDKLFYRDTVYKKLQNIGLEKLRGVFKQRVELDDSYLEELCEFVGDKFGGYSISHVYGRFRASELQTRSEAVRKLIKEEEDYLVDETTAVVKFIIPIQVTKSLVGSEESETSPQLSLGLQNKVGEVDREVQQIEWVFRNLFIATILHTVGQEQIWVLESGRRCQLIRYVAANRDNT